MKGVEKRDTRFLFSEIRSAPRPHLKANSTRATLLFRNNGNVKLTATGNWHKCRPRLALFIHGKTFSSACVFSSLPLPFSLFLFFCPYHPLFIFLLLFPLLLPPSSSSLTALFHLCRVESCVFPLSPLQSSWFVRSLLLLSCLNSFCLLSPPFLLSPFILCFSPPFSFCFQRSLCSSAPPPFSLSFSVSQPSTYTPCRFVSLVPALFFLFFLFSSFFLSVHARACTRVRCTLRANRSLPQAVIIAGVLEAGLPSASRVDSPCLWLSVDSDTRSYSWKKNLEVKDGCVRESLTRWLQRWSSTTHVTKSFNN